MPYPEGICECGAPFAKINKTRKSCGVCQIVRDMNYRPNLKRSCDECGETFHPVRSSYKTCVPCTIRFPQPSKWPACNTCGEHYRSAPGITSTCIYCVMRSPEQRRSYVATLRKLLRLRAEALRDGRPVPITMGEALAQKEADHLA